MKKTVFRVPTWHPKYHLSFADLQTAVAVYDYNLMQAAFKPGHQNTPGTPAFAWFKEISVDPLTQSFLVDFDPALLTKAGFEAIRSGNYKFLSPEFYEPDDPYNPIPGTFYFRGLAYLGAEPPAGKGLDTITSVDLTLLKLDNPPAVWAEPAIVPFKEGEGGIIFDQIKPQDAASHSERGSGGTNVKKEKLLQVILDMGKGVVEDAKLAAFAETLATRMLSDNPEFSELSESSAMRFAERIISAEIETAKARADAEKEKTASAKKAAEFAEKQRSAAIAAAAEKGVVQGRIPAAKKPDFIAFAERMKDSQGADLVLAFGEGEAKKDKPLYAVFFEDILPALVKDKTFAPPAGTIKNDGTNPEFAEFEKAGQAIADSVNPKKES